MSLNSEAVLQLSNSYAQKYKIADEKLVTALAQSQTSGGLACPSLATKIQN